ncbi:MAG TPA: porin, partial [Methylotenera sp.]|nr:porin [Methylotenera sp.]
GVGINRGQNANDTSIDADGKSVTGRATVNIAELMDQKDAVYHLGAAYSDTSDNHDVNAFAIRTEGRGSNIFQSTAPGAVGATNKGYDLKRTGLEGAVAYGPVKFQTEWIKAEFEPDGNNRLVAGAPVGQEKDITAWYAAVNWMITGESYADVYKGGLFGGRMKPKNNFDPKAGKWGAGAWEIGARYSKLDASDFSLGAETADVFNGTNENGKFNEADAWTLGLKWIPSPNVRFLANYVTTDMDCVKGFVCTEDKEKAVNLRAQIDF